MLDILVDESQQREHLLVLEQAIGRFPIAYNQEDFAPIVFNELPVEVIR